MSLARQIEKQKMDRPEYKRQPIGNFLPPPVWEDPRPDLKDDHELWKRLLRLTFRLEDDQKSYELIGVLHGMRCAGTRLVRGKRMYILRPDIGRDCWDSQEQYEEVRDQFLKPFMPEVKMLLELLTKEAAHE